MSTKKRVIRLLLVAPALAAFLVVMGAMGIHDAGKAEAVGPLTVGLDMKTSSTDPGTYGTTLPKFEKCIDVKNAAPQNGIAYIDVVVLNATNLIAFTADVTFNSGRLQVQQADVKKIFGTGSQVMNYSDNVADPATSTVFPTVSSGFYSVDAIDFSGALHSGSGVLVRFKIQTTNIPGGHIIDFKIATSTSDGVTLTADPGATHPGDTNGDGIFDGPFLNANTTAPPAIGTTSHGKIAVDQTADTDGDQISNTCDNCVSVDNGPVEASIPHVGNQDDQDGDGVGDACDPDIDGDGFNNGSDNCPYVSNPTQDPSVCADNDSDGVLNSVDNCPDHANANQANNDGDSQGDVCDTDDDNDGVLDGPDNCDFAANPGQEDWNSNGIGDACNDTDSDNHMDSVDNCRTIPNASQADVDTDGYGDICDNCPSVGNPSQLDTDADFTGNACDTDDDNDTFSDVLETWTGTNLVQRCAATGAPPANAGRNDEAVDSTPYDNDDNRLVNGSDLLSYAPVFGGIYPNPLYDARYDVNMDLKVNGTDLLFFAPFFGKPACVYP